MEIQAALGSDIALVFDECTPFHGGREYTARSTERTHRWLDRCLAWHEAARSRRTRSSTGSSRAGWRRTCGARRPRRSRRARSAASRSAARSARTRTQMFEVVDWAVSELDEERPRHLLGIGEIDDLVRGVELGDRHVRLRDADPDRPPRHGGRARSRRTAGASTSPRAASAPPTSRCSTAARARPARTATRAPTCTTCSRRASRPRSGCSRSTTSPTSQRLMAALRDAIDGGRLAGAAAACTPAPPPGRSR